MRSTELKTFLSCFRHLSDVGLIEFPSYPNGIPADQKSLQFSVFNQKLKPLVPFHNPSQLYKLKKLQAFSYIETHDSDICAQHT